MHGTGVCVCCCCCCCCCCCLTRIQATVRFRLRISSGVDDVCRRTSVLPTMHRTASHPNALLACVVLCCIVLCEYTTCSLLRIGSCIDREGFACYDIRDVLASQQILAPNLEHLWNAVGRYLSPTNWCFEKQRPTTYKATDIGMYHRISDTHKEKRSILVSALALDSQCISYRLVRLRQVHNANANNMQ
jgi:hypothetical protein